MKKIALVTGVAGGIGFATAELLLKNGVNTAYIHSDVDTVERLTALLNRKLRTVKAKSIPDLRAKLFRYAAGQGYDFSTAREVVERLVKSDDQCDELDF